MSTDGKNTSGYDARFYLEDLIGGQKIQIDEHQYASLSDALDTIVSIIDIEEAFQVFAESAIRFEKDLLDVIFEYTYYDTRSRNYDFFFDSARQRFNVNVLTVLTAYKSYDEHCARILKSLISSPVAHQYNSEIRAKAYDANLSYRICDQLRNYAQHRALPLGGLSIGGKSNMIQDTDGKYIKLDAGYNVSPWLNVMTLTGWSKCKPAIQTELKNLCCEKIDMKWLVRSFASAMYDRHNSLREYLTLDIDAACDEISRGYQFAHSINESESKFLNLCSDDNCRPMKSDLGAVLKSMSSACRSLKSAENIYVTSRIVRDEKVYAG
ncbi:hypothetical protein RHIZ_03050 [Rhizobium skierniewicense]|uniref:hypothetical protein n=1 Tax=Rhizobium skierniewicense TaxID=984260 RepID=UPI001FAE317F|nr:hypothetical protein [Rhizobium skierniewicense]MCI9864918.1 hypothetical protein [Rhizobium skierniewicense]